ncbi:MAG: DUF4202 domain-containing protein [Actinobacteria bacterium]|nr:DUF4202 domain-containing protein [Actinomycetota bacterium]
MRSLSARHDAAATAIDAANAADPNTVVVRGDVLPLALAHGRLAAEWVERLHPGAPETWLLAARAHHLRRWELPRSSYPEGRSGYLRWRRDQKARHAHDVAELVVAAGYTEAEIDEVQALIRREHLATDPGAQAVEDAACLVFIETQLADVAGRMDHDKMIEVIRKTARKLSPAGAAAIAEIPLGDTERALLAEALAP